MNVVDSSAWLEYLAAGPNAEFFRAAIEDQDRLLVPTICLFEVFKRVVQQRGETEALRAVAVMQSGKTIVIDEAIALGAAKLSSENKLPMADSIVYFTARSYGATLWTQDADFDGLGSVQYCPKK